MRTSSSLVVSLALLAGGTWLGTGTAHATMEIRKKAKDAGYPAQSCLYCHGENLPKKGAYTHNERGRWLRAEKERRKAREVDPTWLKDYVEAAKSGPHAGGAPEPH